MAVAEFSVRNVTTGPKDMMDTDGQPVKVVVPQVSTLTEVGKTSARVPVFVVLGALVAVGLAVWGATVLIPGQSAEFPIATSVTPVEGLTIFAVFFVGAQAIERLLEPFSLLLVGKKGEAAEAASDANKAAADSGKDEEAVRGLVKVAAEKKAAVADESTTKTVVFWAIATCVGAFATAGFHLYFLSTIGIHTPTLWVEILGSALILGAGTKPLHDLVKLIEKKKESAAASGAGSPS